MNSSIKIWLDAARPKTLPLALVSIVTGSTLAFSTSHFSISVAALSLLTAIFLQILSNLANDYGDAVKGTDNEKRLGPMRAIQSGEVSPKDMRTAIIINVVATIIAGLCLIYVALNTWQDIIAFIGLGLLAIVAAIGYTVGSRPYGYLGFGDLSVFIFFGLLGVCGTYFLHTGSFESFLMLPSIGCGLLAVAVLNINNMRDIENDEKCGKRTIAVRLGQQRAKHYHFVLLAGAVAAFGSYLVLHAHPLWISLPFFLSVIVVAKHAREVWFANHPELIAPMLPKIVKCSIVTNLLFVGVVVAHTLAR